MGNHNEPGTRKKKSDKAKITRQKNGPYSTRSARINLAISTEATKASVQTPKDIKNF